MLAAAMDYQAIDPSAPGGPGRTGVSAPAEPLSAQDRAGLDLHTCPGCGLPLRCTLMLCRGEQHRPHWGCIVSGTVVWPPVSPP